MGNADAVPDPSTTSTTCTTSTTSRTTCAVVGGGPAGLVLGLLLSRAGIEVTVLEKHVDFLRDFRGDTVHPTTLGLLDDLGLFDRFDALPQSHVTRVSVPGPDGTPLPVADLRRLPLRHPYIALVPQWDLLHLLADAASTEPTFTLLTEHTVTAVVERSDRVVGVDYTSPAGSGRLLADLTVGCDGRRSVVRRSVGLPARVFPVEFDVWWYRIPTRRRIGESLWPRTSRGRVAVAAWTACAAGTPRGCSASGTPPTPCPRSAASASTWRCRMPSLPPGFSPAPCAGAPSEARTSAASSPGCTADAPFPPRR